MKLKNIFNIKRVLPLAATAMVLSMSSCVGDLDVDPTIDKSTNMTFNRDGYFAKIYANMALTGQQGPAGNQDIADIDEGTSDFFRQIWNMNELPTDEAICCWGDAGVPELNFGTWDASHGFVTCMYYRLYFGITLANDFLAQAAGDNSPEATKQKAEARFLRALYYSYVIDFFGNGPFVTTLSAENAPYAKRADLFAYVESELKGCYADLAEAGTNTYGRVDKVAADLLLARLYLNAEVYTGTARWEDAATYADKVMKSSYKLSDKYANLFMGDNNVNGAQKEIILPILQDGIDTQNYGGSLFLIASSHKDDMASTGTSENWAGNRARKELLAKFFPTTDAPSVAPDVMVLEAGDDRAMFHGTDRALSVDEISVFTDGYSIAKFTNLYATGGSPRDVKFVDMDVPFMRAAEAYLTYAEAKTRLGKADEAKVAIDALRNRANATTQPTYSLNDICDEWSREFYFEGRRRTDLIRFGKFGGNSDYTWEWKGGQRNGTSIAAYRNIYAIPTKDYVANNNLEQNPGYGD